MFVMTFTKFRIAIRAAAVGFAMLPFFVASQAMAAFVFNGVTPTSGDILSFKLFDWEVVLDKAAIDGIGGLSSPPTGAQVLATKQAGGLVNDVGDQLYGIIKITSIENLTTGAQAWHSALDQELAGLFWGYTTKVVPGALGGGSFSPASFTGGNVNLFFDGTPDFTAATGPFSGGWVDVATSNKVGNAGDTPFMNTFAVGGIDLDPTVTLKSTFTALSLTRVTGVGDGFLTVTFSSDLIFALDGLDGATVSPPYPGNQTLSLKSNFDSANAIGVAFESTIGWSLQSSDPVNGVFLASVPEPTSLTIFGIGGCLSLVFAGLRRRGKSTNLVS